jgi:hypothetical protein
VSAKLLLQRSFGRYPAAARQNSSNYNPIPPWSLGIQMVRVFHGGSHLQALRAFECRWHTASMVHYGISRQYSQWGRRAASADPQMVAPLSRLHDVPRVRSARAACAICVKPSCTAVLSQSARPPVLAVNRARHSAAQVALNFQTVTSAPMALNRARFEENGNCG